MTHLEDRSDTVSIVAPEPSIAASLRDALRFARHSRRHSRGANARAREMGSRNANVRAVAVVLHASVGALN